MVGVAGHDALKGYLYVEAYKASDVKAALYGLRDIQWFKPTMVPILQMVEVRRALTLATAFH